MSGIFLEPEATFSVDIIHKGGALFELVDGGPYALRTATGREFARIAQAFRDNDSAEAFGIVERHLVGGIDKAKIGCLHPNVAALMAAEVAKRSHLSETDAGN